MRMGKAKRWLTGILAAVMVMSLLPMEAMAAGLDDATGQMYVDTETPAAALEEAGEKTVSGGGKFGVHY